MAITLQFNKTSLQQLDKDLKVRLSALPILKAKESALRVEVAKARDIAEGIRRELEDKMEEVGDSARLWCEFPNLLRLSDVGVARKNIAGVKVPDLKGVRFDEGRFSMFSHPSWIKSGIEALKTVAELKVGLKIAEKGASILEHARKKTTQKVNLYEKVQVPEYEEGILKIKRFLEDEENLGKSAQKILKTKKSRIEAAA